MFARKIVPILLVAGAVHLMLHHSQYGFEEQPGLPGDGVGRGPQFRPGPFARTRRLGQSRPADVRDAAQSRARGAGCGAERRTKQPDCATVHARRLNGSDTTTQRP